ncbi:MAG: RNA polymerase sigma-70 factor [Tannerellaceae bacterium]|nr:RNA polymerase sigma-70 factor [Tannerellaceae bacterium]
MVEANSNNLFSMEVAFRRFYKPLRAYAYRFVNDRNLAEDIVQDIFFELWNKRAVIRFDKDLKSYLFKSVYNRSINALHYQYKRSFNSLETIAEDEILEQFLISTLEGQEDSLLIKELQHEINQYIETLPQQCKNIFLLSRREGLKNREIAEQLGISIKAVEKQISKALLGLRKHLNEKDLLFLLWLFKMYN